MQYLPVLVMLTETLSKPFASFLCHVMFTNFTSVSAANAPGPKYRST